MKRRLIWAIITVLCIAACLVVTSCGGLNTPSSTGSSSDINIEDNKTPSHSGADTGNGSKDNDQCLDSSHKHEYGEWELLLQPTCVDNGKIQKSCVCGDRVTEELKAFGHVSQVIEGKEPTCTETGLTDGEKCSVCQEALSPQNEIPTKEHQLVDLPGLAPTCTEEGWTDGKTCIQCNQEIVLRQKVDMLVHKANSKGYCSHCSLLMVDSAIVLAVDISSSMKRSFSGEKSLFELMLQTLEQTLEKYPSNSLIGVVAFDGSAYVELDIQLVTEENKASLAETLRYNLEHSFYNFYMNPDGTESDIIVNKNDGDKYTSQGYFYVVNRAGQYDDCGNMIRTYGTSYGNAINQAHELLKEVETEEKGILLITDGAPNDRSAYVEALEKSVQEGITTSAIGIVYDERESHEKEVTRVSSIGGGIARIVKSEGELMPALDEVLSCMNTYVVTEDGYAFFEYDGEAYLFNYVGEGSDLILPNEWEGKAYTIYEGAFAHKSNILTVILPNCLTSVSKDMFYECTSLTGVTIPSGITFIEKDAFSYCWALKSVIFEDASGWYSVCMRPDGTIEELEENSLEDSELAAFRLRGVSEYWYKKQD